MQTGERDLHSGHYGGTALNAIHGILGGKPGLRNTTLVSRAAAGITIRVAPGQDPAVVAAAAE